MGQTARAGEAVAQEAPLLPLFLKLARRKVLLVGGGRVAFSKLEGLVRCGARVTVVSPEVLPEIERTGVAVVRRAFVPSDLEEAWLVVAAGPLEVNRRVAAAAQQRRIFVNAVDDPVRASAFAGAVFRRAGVTVAISTDGEAPALAGLLREGLELLIPEEIEAWVRQARRLKRRWREEGLAMPRRRPQLLRALNTLYAGKGCAAEGLEPREAESRAVKERP